jgi:MoaA/NifB/PqqE/SkfB family radical SAM enzyme
MISKLRQVASAFARREISFELDLVPLRFEGLPLKKMSNWVLTESSVVFKPGRPWGYPTVMQVEPTSRCNLRCKVCPVATGLGRPVGNMDLKLYRRLIDEVGEYLLLVMFWDWGEPFLNPNAYEMIQYARRAGIKVVCSTNGHVFADGDQARRVVESGLDVLVFSVDGITQQTYERFRDRGELETVLQGIRNVVGEKRRQGSATPVVNFRFIVTKHGEGEVPLLKGYARSLGVDVLTLRKFHFVPGTETDGEGSSLVPNQLDYQLPPLSGDGRQPLRLVRNPCRNLWNCPTVHWDGTVCSCFMDYSERRPLGSLVERRFREIWYGEPYRKLRRAFRKRWHEVPLCGDCASGFAGGDVGREANAEAVFFDGNGGGR